MSIPINYGPRMIAHLIAKKILEASPFFLLDVGASGGIENYWNVFGQAFRAIGFDPMIEECEKLNKNNANPNICYEDYYIIAEIDELDSKPRDLYATSLFERSSAAAAQKTVFRSPLKTTFTKRKISLNRYVKENDLENPNFIKIDVDGFDYRVLKGADTLLSNPSTLGLMVECQFHGSSEPDSNTFRNIDRLLVDFGFTLQHLTVNKYSKKVLPGKFAYNLFAQTINGQAYWGDAVYLRDPEFIRAKQLELSNIEILKLACLQELFGLSDCAAELLLQYKTPLSELINIDYCLNLLTQNTGLYQNYEEHLRAFEENPKSFFSLNTVKRMFPSLSSDLKRLLDYAKLRLFK